MPGSFPRPLPGRFAVLAQIASLTVTAVLVWNSAVRPRLLFEPLSAVIGHALLYAVLAWFFAALITLVLYLVLPRGSGAWVMTSTFHTAAVAVRLAPACILLSQ